MNNNRKHFSKIDFKSTLIAILVLVIVWLVYVDYHKNGNIINNSNYVTQLEIARLKNIESGDNASMCAAIYALTEEGMLGQGLEFLIFINPIDKDEEEISRIVRVFYSVALEYYKNSGETDISAKYLADYTVIENITFLRGLKVGGVLKRAYPSACEEILKEVEAISNTDITPVE